MSSNLLTAFYLMNHAYLSCAGQIINFGGQYLYEIESTGDDIVISREKNPSFQDGFFNISKSKIKMANVSAVVGQNGVGKSSILNSIRQHFIESPNAFAHCDSLILFENGKKVNYSTNRRGLKVHLKEADRFISLEEIKTGSIQTIYYSPHFDLRFNRNFDEIDYHDISLDHYLDLDLEDLDSRGSNENGFDYPVKQELLFKNSRRQIRFLNSTLVTQKKIFEGLIEFPSHGNALFVTRDTKYDENLRNVPSAFLTPLKELREQIKKDLDQWTGIRQVDKNKRILNQVDINRYLIQRYFVQNLLSVIVRQMDVENHNRDKGEFDDEIFKLNRGTSSLDGFLAFIKSCRIPIPKGMVLPFDADLIERLLHKLYSVTNAITSENDISSSSFQSSSDDAIAILELQNKVVFNISNYYNQQWSHTPNNYKQLNYFVSSFIFYSPAERHLSSGENAFLNFFSKLYDFLMDKLNPKINPKREVRSYLLLLDEADLGFHPLWKKKYLYILTRTLTYFFEQFSELKILQLIFTTHDPLTLSDLPNNNVIYLRTDDDKVKVLNHSERRPTFAANITDLLADSFFIDNALVGDFAQHKIKEVIDWLNQDSKEEAEMFKQIIEIIDEPIVKQKLAEMYDEKMSQSLEISIINKQLEELNLRKSKLLHDRNTNK